MISPPWPLTGSPRSGSSCWRWSATARSPPQEPRWRRPWAWPRPRRCSPNWPTTGTSGSSQRKGPSRTPCGIETDATCGEGIHHRPKTAAAGAAASIDVGSSPAAHWPRSQRTPRKRSHAMTENVPTYPDLQGKVALITGGSGGIGAATCRLLAANGARVAVNGRDEAKIDAVVEEIRSAGGEAVGVPADCTDLAAVEGMRRRAEEELGPPRSWRRSSAGAG